MTIDKNLIQLDIKRFDRWANFINSRDLRKILEIGVYKGDFAKSIVDQCNNIESYFMLDPWRNMKKEDWNSVYNHSQNMDEIYQIALEATESFKHKRNILRGTTSEVIYNIDDQSLDFIYVDGDHSLKGISIDLITSWNKLKKNGFIAGHDFKPLAWKSDVNIEPYFVFPFAVYFAEAMNVKIYGLPSNEFLIAKSEVGFEFIDLTESKKFKITDVLNQINNLPYRYLYKIILRKILGR